jgi:uncharacterized protein (TIGR02996 family)
MPTEDDLLAGIVANPREVERWLILADWLEDQQDPRAELARLRWQFHAEPDHPDERPARVQRQRALLKEGLAPVVPTWTNSLGAPFALILAGTFWMGTPKGKGYRGSDEFHHPVTLVEPYFLGIYPVTVGEFRTFVQATGYRTDAERGDGTTGLVGTGWRREPSYVWHSPGFPQADDYPATCLSWNDGQAMVNWLNEVEGDMGRVYSLPTEEQWECACRAGGDGDYFWGNDRRLLGRYTWYDRNADSRTHSVKTKLPNPWGLYHILGMIWEWCGDGYVTWQATSSRKRQRQPSVNPNVHAVRGGSWANDADLCRTAYRVSYSKDTRYTASGIRLAVSVGTAGGV